MEHRQLKEQCENPKEVKCFKNKELKSKELKS